MTVPKGGGDARRDEFRGGGLIKVSYFQGGFQGVQNSRRASGIIAPLSSRNHEISVCKEQHASTKVPPRIPVHSMGIRSTEASASHIVNRNACLALHIMGSAAF